MIPFAEAFCPGTPTTAAPLRRPVIRHVHRLAAAACGFGAENAGDGVVERGEDVDRRRAVFAEGGEEVAQHPVFRGAVAAATGAFGWVEAVGEVALAVCRQRMPGRRRARVAGLE